VTDLNSKYITCTFWYISIAERYETKYCVHVYAHTNIIYQL